MDEQPQGTVRKLYRSRSNKVLGGVAAGMAEHFSLDPTLVRLGWVAFALFGGGGIVLYIIAWIIIPEKPRSPDDPPDPPRDTNMIAVAGGALLIALGLFAITASYGWPLLRLIIPVALIATGFLIIIGKR